MRKATHNFQKLAFHLVFPSLGFELFGTTENMLDSSRNHSLSRFGLHGAEAFKWMKGKHK